MSYKHFTGSFKIGQLIALISIEFEVFDYADSNDRTCFSFQYGRKLLDYDFCNSVYTKLLTLDWKISIFHPSDVR
jgi:hypothetical protein